MKFVKSVLLASLLLFGAPLFAAIETNMFDSPEQEALYKKMTEELRCLVCQNQNLADSNADLAKDLRDKTYELIKAGNNEEQIVEYMVARYGDFVLYRPPVKSTTWLLWVGPFLFLAIAVIIALRFSSRRQSTGDPEIDDDQLEKARDLLNKEKDKS